MPGWVYFTWSRVKISWNGTLLRQLSQVGTPIPLYRDYLISYQTAIKKATIISVDSLRQRLDLFQ
jgi:hypothetical protein